MAIDMFNEDLMTLEEARSHRLLRKPGGKRPDFKTLVRWAKLGVRGVTLETVMKPSGYHTSEQAIVRFFERLTAPHGGGSCPNRVSPPTPAQAAIAHAKAKERLKAFGIGVKPDDPIKRLAAAGI